PRPSSAGPTWCASSTWAREVVPTLLDVMAVRASGDSALALVELGEPPLRMEERRCEVLVVGGGTGGVAAALAAARAGRGVCLLEETDWIGGQLTAQGVSALDEHEHIERFGGTRSYYTLRRGLPGHYCPPPPPPSPGA